METHCYCESRQVSNSSVWCVLMCKWAELRPPELKDGFWSLRGPHQVRGPKDERWMASGNLKNRATVERLCRTGWPETSSFSPPLSFFMRLAGSPVLCLCSYSEQVGWVTQLLCSGPLTTYLLLFLPPLYLFFFCPLLSTFPPYSPFNLFSISRSICALQVLGWTDKHWLGFGGVVCSGGGTQEKSGGLRERSSVFCVVAVDCRSVCALSVEVSHLPQ